MVYSHMAVPTRPKHLSVNVVFGDLQIRNTNVPKSIANSDTVWVGMFLNNSGNYLSQTISDVPKKKTQK